MFGAAQQPIAPAAATSTSATGLFGATTTGTTPAGGLFGQPSSGGGVGAGAGLFAAKTTTAAATATGCINKTAINLCICLIMLTHCFAGGTNLFGATGGIGSLNTSATTTTGSTGLFGQSNTAGAGMLIVIIHNMNIVE